MSDFAASTPPDMSVADAMTARRAALRLLGLESATPLPAWVILNGVRNQNFSGEVTLFTLPAVRVWAIDGHVYWAERPGALTAADRLVELGALTAEQARLGGVRLGDVTYLGHLFERVPGIEREEVLRALDYVRDSITAEIADLLTERIDVVPHRHHVSGMVFWFDAEQSVPSPEPVDAAPQRLPTVMERPAVAERPTVMERPAVAERPTLAEHLISPEPPDVETPDPDVVHAVRSVLDEIRAALGGRPGRDPTPAPTTAAPTLAAATSTSLSPVWDLPFNSLLDPAPSPPAVKSPPATRPEPDAAPRTLPPLAPPTSAAPSLPITVAPNDPPPSCDVDIADPTAVHPSDAPSEGPADIDDFAVVDEGDDFGPVAPAAPRRAVRTPASTYSAPVEYEPAPAPVVSIAEASQQPVSGLRRLIGGRRR